MKQPVADDVVAEIIAAGGEAAANYDSVENGAAIVADCMETFGRIDIVVNNAGILTPEVWSDLTLESWQRTINVNLTGVFSVMQAAWPHFVEAKYGRCIVTASPAMHGAGVAAYAASKAGVIGLTKAVAADFVGQGIRCNCICPGTVDTPSLQQRLHDTGDYDAAQSAFVARQPMGRLGRAEEIAALVLYLASDEAAFTTGAVHVIDGGWVM